MCVCVSGGEGERTFDKVGHLGGGVPIFLVGGGGTKFFARKGR